MADADQIPWGKVTAVAGGALVLALVVRGAIGIVHIAVGEARYRVNDPDTWLKRLP